MINNDLDKKQKLDDIIISSNRSDAAKRAASVISADRSESIINNIRSDWKYDRLKVQDQNK